MSVRSFINHKRSPFHEHCSILSDCLAQFRVDQDVSAPDGVSAGSGTFTLTTCILECLEADDCIAVDYKDGECWIHTIQDNVDKKGQASGVQHATKGECASKGCYMICIVLLEVASFKYISLVS